jgi:hypothetical protein
MHRKTKSRLIHRANALPDRRHLIGSAVDILQPQGQSGQRRLQPRQRGPIQQPPNKYMRIQHNSGAEAGKIGWILLWLVGIPLPVLLILFLLRGCT